MDGFLWKKVRNIWRKCAASVSRTTNERLGNRGAYCLHRVDGNLAYFQMLTFWDDVDAIKRFAGEDYQRSRYYDFDDDFLIEKEPFVLHFEVYKR
jgi:hypothetical protein